MFFTVSDEVHDTIESIQRNSLLILGADIDRILKEISDDDVDLTISADELHKEYERFKRNPHALFPEYIYDTSLEFYKFSRSFRVTKYDKSPFLQRFANIIPLCHELYTGGDNSLKKNIIVTTLPFINMNGICLDRNKEDSSHVVFLNEGLLSTIPIIYRHLLPICDPLLFANQKNEGDIQQVIDIIGNLYFFKDSYVDSRESGDIANPHAKEKWLYQAALTEHVMSNLGKGSNDNKNQNSELIFKHPSEYPFSDQVAQFLACRGAFVFLLGHEFSHVYDDHCQIKNIDDVDLRNPDFLSFMQRTFPDEIKEYNMADSNYENFHISQPLEEEADTHGLQCVLKYCADNDLDDQRTTCVIVGAIATFIVMSIHEQFSCIHDFGVDSAKQYLEIDPLIRNMFFVGEHPAPVTRLEMALKHEHLKDSGAHQFLSNMNGVLVNICDAISKHILNNASPIEQFLSSSEVLNADASEIFKDCLTLGLQDLSAKHHSRIKRHFFHRKAPVIQLFGER
ncbi:MAG: hypothetical protein ACRBBR_06650 [Cellvibrionaceae bacterium]